ncbi:MAG: PAS domain S-box protein [Labilithrix sp.]|nr:PAS domain S-box protein [Labilithrix sp.]MCW5817266.1 PAS domain S-box protein [Labilithrix sp.]
MQGAGFERGQREILERIAYDAPAGDVLEQIVRLIERQGDDLVCSVLLLDGEHGCVRHAASPSLPPAYSARLDGLPIGPGEGSCGAAAYLGARVIVDDIAVHPNWERYRALALPFGLRACWSTPIFSPERKVLGTFAIYYREPRRPTEIEMEWVDAATHLAAIAILRERSEDERRRLVRVLDERVKELTLLHRCSRLLQDAREVDVETLRAVVELLPQAWTRPDTCAARVRWLGTTLASAGFAETPWTLEAPLVTGSSRGTIEIAYHDEHPFLEEERDLLTSVAGIVSAHLDRAQTEVDLRQSEARLRSVVEHTPDVAIQWYDAEGRILFCNRASDRLFGWAPGAAIGKTLVELGFFTPAEESVFAECRRAAARGEKVEPREFRYRRVDGTTGYLLSTVFEIPFTKTERCYVCMDIELTEHRRMEEAVHAGEALRAQIYSLVEDAIFYLGVEEERRFRFLSVNPAFLAMTGLSERDVIGETIDEVIPEPSLSFVREKYEEAIRTGRGVTWDEITRYPSGVKHGEVSVSPVVDAQGRATHLVGTVHDVTARRAAEEERRRLEGQLQQGQRLQSLGTLAAGIAHDFKNVLAVVNANAELALLDVEDPTACRESLHALQRATRQATELVRRILTFSREQAPDRDVLDLRAVVDEALELVRVTLPAGVELRRRYEPAPHVVADAVQIHQVVMNLATNAAHAMQGRSGAIEVQLGRRRFEADASMPSPDLRPGDYVSLSVRDDGCGMDEPTTRRVFDPFFTTKPHGEGTGLGLSTVHGIVKAHDGAIALESTPDVGTTFTLFFPAAAPAPVVAPAAPSPGAARVLYVDDEDALVYLAKRALERLGHTVTGHTDPVLALREFRARPDDFDVLITDISMPGLSGADLADAVLEIRDDLPIVMVTGFVRNEDWLAAERLGIRHVLPKPMTVEELVRTIGPLLTRAHIVTPGGVRA